MDESVARRVTPVSCTLRSLEKKTKTWALEPNHFGGTSDLCFFTAERKKKRKTQTPFFPRAGLGPSSSSCFHSYLRLVKCTAFILGPSGCGWFERCSSPRRFVLWVSHPHIMWVNVSKVRRTHSTSSGFPSSRCLRGALYRTVSEN